MVTHAPRSHQRKVLEREIARPHRLCAQRRGGPHRGKRQAAPQREGGDRSVAILHSIVSALVDYPPVAASVGTLLALVGIDAVLGIAAAVKTKSFRLSKVGDFVGGDLLKTLVVLAFGIGAGYNGYLAGMFYLAAGATLTALVGKINTNFKTVFGISPNVPPPPLPR